MIVIGLDGKEYKWNPKSKPKANASKLHILARNLLKEIFPFSNVYEEVELSGTRITKNLVADFYLPTQQLIIEVQGQQHYKYGFFHGTKIEFFRAKQRDLNKKLWCEINKIGFVELPYSETIDEWRKRIKGIGSTRQME